MASYFFRLPREIRDKIYSHVFGLRTIHVRSECFQHPDHGRNFDLEVNDAPYDIDDYDERLSKMVYTDGLRYDKCYDPTPEVEAYKGSQQTDPNDPYGLRPICRGSPKRCRFCKRHDRCWETKGGAWNLNDKRFGLLMVSKTIHEEAMARLYTNTTFAFQLAYTLEKFVTDLIPWRRHLIKNIRFSIYKAFPPSAWFWPSDNIAHTMTLLTGLRTLHIHIVQWCPGAVLSIQFHSLSHGYDPAFQTPYGQHLDELSTKETPWWENEIELFRKKGLKEVTVIIDDTDRTPIFNQNYGLYDQELLKWRTRQWTMEERAEIARRLRRKLLDG